MSTNNNLNSTSRVAASIEPDFNGVSAVPVYNADTTGRYSNFTNLTQDGWDYVNYNWDYGNYDSEYVTNDMEVNKDYVLDYSRYRQVLNDCNRTIHETPYPDDGK